jgi:PAS domain S-box-containing protein
MDERAFDRKTPELAGADATAEEASESDALRGELSKDSEQVLRDYLNGTVDDLALERASQLGRRAFAVGLGVLDMARIHQDALLSVSARERTSEGCVRALTAAGELFIRSMTPFDRAHRELRETDAALRASEERYRELFENAHDIVFTADLEGNFTSINRAGERLSGYDRSQVLSMNFTAVIPSEYFEGARQAREMKLSGEEDSTTYELELLTRSGKRIPLEVNTRLICQDGKPIGVQGIARDITERKHAEQALRRMNARLEAEARRIAHALHDEAGQLLVSVHLAVAEVASELPPAARERLQRVSVLLDQVSDQLRHVAHELRPAVLDDFGLVAAIKFLAEGVSRRAGLAVTVEASMDERLPSSIETAVYRIVQETLNNVRKHAQAGHVTMRLWKERRLIRYAIEDDGIGFEPRADRSRRTKACFGLVGIRERLADLGGTLTVATGAGRGTTLDIGIPIDGSVRCPARRVTDQRARARAT